MSSECPVTRNIRLLKDPDAKVRRNAAETLGRSMNKKALQPLIDLLKTEQELEVRRATVLALSFLSDDETLPLLMDILRSDKDLETRRNAAGGLRFFGDRVDAKELVKLVLNETDKVIRDVLVGTIIYLRDEAIIPEVMKKCKASTETELTGCLLEIIGSFDTKESKELLKVYTSPEYSEQLRLIATRALGKFDDLTLIPHIFDISQNDPSEAIKEYAHKVLDELSVMLGYVSIDQMVLEYINQSRTE